MATETKRGVDELLPSGWADGTVRTLDDAEECPLSHPNCGLAWAPVVGGQ